MLILASVFQLVESQIESYIYDSGEEAYQDIGVGLALVSLVDYDDAVRAEQEVRGQLVQQYPISHELNHHTLTPLAYLFIPHLIPHSLAQLLPHLLGHSLR